MVLPLVVHTEKMTKIKDYKVKEGLYLTEKGRLVLATKDGSIYDLHGSEYNGESEKGYTCHIEGGIAGIYPYGVTVKERDDKIDTHPAYGVVQLSKSTVNPAVPLFGSSIKHGNLINIKICHAELKRGINHDWYHSNGRICEIELSLSQFADMITSVGNGDGVPCTIHFTETEGTLPRIKYTSKVEQYCEEFEDQLSGVKDTLDETYNQVKNLFDSKKTLNKADRELILSAISKARREVGSNASYVLESFNEQMDKTVTEAKGEIEAFMQHKIHSVAMEAIAANMNKEELLPELESLISVE